jgi:hypothetical protein
LVHTSPACLLFWHFPCGALVQMHDVEVDSHVRQSVRRYGFGNGIVSWGDHLAGLQPFVRMQLSLAGGSASI